MGFLKRKNEILKKIELEKQRMKQERIRKFLDEIKEISKKHKLVLIPIISKYGPTFEVQELQEESNSSSSSEEPKPSSSSSSE